MTMATTGIALQRILDTPVAIIDFETTGLTAGADRVIEVSVVRVDPGQEPRLVLDTLVNPHRSVAATEIHGITDADVAQAPSFGEVAGELLRVADGCMIAAYNVYFDIKFLRFEMANLGIEHEPPHLCLMYMRPLLGLGCKCKLQDACRENGINYDPTHVAAEDAMAAARLFKCYLNKLGEKQISTYDQLMRLRSYKFLKSFLNAPYPPPSAFSLSRGSQLSSRSKNLRKAGADPKRNALTQYWDTLKTVVADLDISDDELQHAVAERKRLGLTKEEIRVLHARAFASAIAQFVDDQWLDEREVQKLHRLRTCLNKLGWAPGDKSVARNRPVSASPTPSNTSKLRRYDIVNVEQGTSEWLSWRRNGLGASDAPTVMGENPWKSARELLREKHATSIKRWQNAAMAKGIRLEPEARKMYEQKKGVSVTPVCIQSTQFEWLRASLDGLSDDQQTVVEIKCGESVYNSVLSYNTIPDYYYGQVQHILAITGLHNLDFWCWLPEKRGLLVRVERETRYIEQMIQAERSFWKKVEQNV